MTAAELAEFRELQEEVRVLGECVDGLMAERADRMRKGRSRLPHDREDPYLQAKLWEPPTA